jgi:MFS transporter, FLVCR family, feline leukemia virus subgroup C receptor-related protein
VCSFAQLFTLAIPPSLSMTWFPSNERSLATGIGVFANQMGTALGLGVTSQIVGSNMGSNLTLYLSAQFVMSFVSMMLILSFANDRPENAPSASAAVSFDRRDEDEDEDVTTTFRSFLYCSIVVPLRDSRNLMLLTAAYGISTGVFYAIATDLSQILDDSNSSASSSTLGLAIVLAGTVGTLICGYLLDRTRAFRYITRALFITTTFELILWTILLGFFNADGNVLLIVSCIFGFTITAIISTGFELAVELTFPLDEAIVAGILNISAQIFGCVLIWISDLLLDGTFVCVCVCVCVCVW